MRTKPSKFMRAIVMGLLAVPTVGVPAHGQEPAPRAPAEFTGTWCIGPAVSPEREGTETSLAVGDDGMTLTRYQGGAWRNTITISDPRLQGDVYQTYESDTYATGPSVIASTMSIVTEDGAWVSASYRATVDGADPGDSPDIFIGQDAYDGMVALIEGLSGPGQCSEIRGIIFDRPPVPAPYLPE